MNSSAPQTPAARPHSPASSAGLHTRLAAAGVDALVCLPMVAGAEWVLAEMFELKSLGAAPRVLSQVLAASVPAFAYLLAGDASPRGATWGKRLARLRVVEVYGSRPSLARVACRVAAKMAPWQLLAFAMLYPRSAFGPVELGVRPWLFAAYAALGLYLAAAMLTLKKQSVHDLATGTCVIAEPR